MLLDKLPSLRAPDRNRWSIAGSLLLHLVLLVLAVLYEPDPIERSVEYIELGEPAPEVTWSGPGGAPRGAAVTAGRAGARPEPPLPVQPPVTAAGPVPLGAGGPPGRDSSGVVDTHRPLEPALGDGRLWVRVEDLPEGLPARRGAADVAGHVALVDSALAAKIRAYLDTVPPDSFATRGAPKWTTEIAGQTWGLDGQWIYLGPIKIPTAILAMLPVPSGNYDEAQKALLLQRMREDIMQAAMRARNNEDFRRYVKELRERKDIERNQRVPPPPPRDTLIP